MASLRVDTHVLVQLGSELVTDAEQAILECVKNAYDADSRTCRIEIDTTATGVIEDFDEAKVLRHFAESSETVRAELFDEEGQLLEAGAPDVPDKAKIKRRLTWSGRITIADTGDGMSEQQLQDSWLVVSRSAKRSTDGRKTETSERRTPLGDKGLGRLGTMKLGDILSVESAPSPQAPVGVARFRWADCEAAPTIDQIPVIVRNEPNSKRLKGTEVSVFGLKDLAEWKRKDRVVEIAGRLTRLISPFETASKFRVGLSFDGTDYSLTAVTREVLDSCIARFDFEWKGGQLSAKARFRSRLFSPARQGKQHEKAKKAFVPDKGVGFRAYLPTFVRIMRTYTLADRSEGWFAELKSDKAWAMINPGRGSDVADPGPFSGSFYYFHLDSFDDDPDKSQLLLANATVIKEMAGVSILREGFQVRSHGDWLDLAAGMTSGSTYQLRVSNTVGFFALTGKENYALVEKSDREGFVENAAYRGFLAIARECSKFANESLEAVRRAFDEYAKRFDHPEGAPPTAAASLKAVQRQSEISVRAHQKAKTAAASLRSQVEILQAELDSGRRPSAATLESFKKSSKDLDEVAKTFEDGQFPTGAVERIRLELDDNREQMTALFEGAAVGLSARGLAHELRTHLTEIRSATSRLERFARTLADGASVKADLRTIKGACTEIQKAAALIDPMLPRSRSLKETFELAEFVTSYCTARLSAFERAGIRTDIRAAPDSGTVRTNRPRLLQALDNLVRNAVYWVQRDEVEGSHLERVITIEVPRGQIIVRDSGPGVDERLEASLFEIFVSGRPDRDGGQGLGLFITRYLLEQMGCEVRLGQHRNAAGRYDEFVMDLDAIVVENAG